MQANALKMVPSGQSKPVRPVEPVEPVLKHEKPVLKHDLKPVTPEKTAFEASGPANDPFMGLISGTAPDPASEIPTGPEPVRPVETGTETGDGWQPKVLDLDSAREETGPKYLKLVPSTGAPQSSGVMSEAEFIEWWAIEVWDGIAAIGGFIPVINLDLSELRTKEEDYDQARTAAAHLYKIALRNKWLAWMVADNNTVVGDWLFCLSFFGGKALAILAVIMEKKREWVEKKRAKKNRSDRSNQSENRSENQSDGSNRSNQSNQSNRSEPVKAKGGEHG